MKSGESTYLMMSGLEVVESQNPDVTIYVCIRESKTNHSPVKIAKIEKKNRVVLKIGIIVEGNVLNNILKVPAGGR